MNIFYIMLHEKFINIHYTIYCANIVKDIYKLVMLYKFGYPISITKNKKPDYNFKKYFLLFSVINTLTVK